ncbi:MAG: hypothetical protein JWM11_2128 [Planctomycetaceae bacterium]|nr:hypothetical protein [Planctomycetaceae bacterium]
MVKDNREAGPNCVAHSSYPLKRNRLLISLQLLKTGSTRTGHIVIRTQEGHLR